MTPTDPVSTSACKAARYMRLAWYQWLIPAPMITVHLPFVRSAVVPHSRANLTRSARETPVYFSDHAGVKGRSASSYPVG